MLPHVKPGALLQSCSWTHRGVRTILLPVRLSPSSPPVSWYATATALQACISSAHSRIVPVMQACPACVASAARPASLYCLYYFALSGSCSNCRVIQALYPDTAAEWDYTKDQGQPSDYPSGSTYLAWWSSPQRGSWQATIHARTTSAKAKSARLIGRQQRLDATHLF